MSPSSEPFGKTKSFGLKGRVVSILTDEPIAGAKVEVGGLTTQTDTAGYFYLPLPPGAYDVYMAAPGYLGMTLLGRPAQPGGQSLQIFEMVPARPTEAETHLIEQRLLARRTTADPTLQSVQLTPSVLDHIHVLPRTIRVLMSEGTIVAMDVDEYVRGVLPAEIGPLRPAEALKAQAAAARAYAATRCLPESAGDPTQCEPGLDANVDTTVRTQVYDPVRRFDTTDAAVRATRGVAPRYGGRLIQALFFAHSDGRTRPSEDVFSSAIPYLRSVADPAPFDFMHGHGVGLSQLGAAVLADWGATFDEILSYFYQGATVDLPQPPALSDPSVLPPDPNSLTPLRFEITYADPEDDPPVTADVYIDGHAHPMRFLAGELYTGARFVYTTTLPTGAHTYDFHFSDGFGAPVSVDGGKLDVTAAADPTPTPPDGNGTRSGQWRFSSRLDWLAGERTGLRITEETDAALVLDDNVTSATYISAALAADFPFIAVGANWQADLLRGTTLSIQVQTSPDGATWSAWIDLPADGGGRWQPLDDWTELAFVSGRFLRYRITLTRSEPATLTPRLDGLTLTYISPLAQNWERGARGVRAPVPEHPSPLAQNWERGARGVRAPVWGHSSPLAQNWERGARGVRAPASHPKPTLIPRDVWCPDCPLPTSWPPEYRTPAKFIVHPMASFSDVDGYQAIRAIYHYHANIRGWGDIGYNFLIDGEGRIFEGRYGGENADGEIVVGGHARHFSYGSVGVAVMGLCSDAETSMMAVEALVGFLIDKGLAYDIGPFDGGPLAGVPFPHGILSHYAVLPQRSACPAQTVEERLHDIRTRVDVGIREHTGEPTATPTATPPAGCAEAVLNGSFEQGNVGWSLNRAYYMLQARSGSQALLIGLLNSEPDQPVFASAQQPISVPANVTSVDLSFWYETVANGDADDRFIVRVFGPDNAVLFARDLPPDTPGWQPANEDLPDVLLGQADETVRLYFGVVNDGDTEGKKAYMRLDDVTLIICGDASTPSPTPMPAVSGTPTITLTATLTPTPAPMPTPSPTPANLVCEDLVRNPSFEAGAASWTIPATSYAGRITTTQVHTGEHAALVGISDSGEDIFSFSALWQAVTVPVDAERITISYWYYPTSQDLADRQIVEIREPNQEGRYQLREGTGDPSGEQRWLSGVYDLAKEYASKPIQLYFGTFNRNQKDQPGGVTAMYVDDVSLVVCHPMRPRQVYLPLLVR